MSTGRTCNEAAANCRNCGQKNPKKLVICSKCDHQTTTPQSSPPARRTEVGLPPPARSPAAVGGMRNAPVTGGRARGAYGGPNAAAREAADAAAEADAAADVAARLTVSVNARTSQYRVR